MATLKHIASKNSDYTAIEAYLVYQHDEFSGKVILDEQGRPMLRESYLLDTLECGDFSFATACLLANRKYGKNTQHGDIKSHQYIISFDPRDAADNGLTMEKAQALGLKFCSENFPGHPAIVCTHPDGHNRSGNIHVHIVIGSIRTREVERKPYMQKPRDWREGMKHSSTAQTMRHLRVEVMELCEGAGLYQIDLLNGSKERVSEAEYWARRRGQLKLDRENAALTTAGQQPRQKKFETVKDTLRRQISSVLHRATSFEDFSDRLLQQYGIAVKESREQLSYLPAGRTKFIRAKHLGDNYDKKAVFATLNANAEHKPKVQFKQDTIGKLIDIQAKLAKGKGTGYERWAKKYNLKAMAQTLILLQEKDLLNEDALNQRIAELETKYHDALAVVKDLEGRMKFNKELRYQVAAYASTKIITQQLKAAKRPAAFEEQHRAELTAYRAAAAYFKANNDTALPAHELGIYMEEDWKMNKRIRLNAGVHLGLYTIDGKTYTSLEPRFSSRFLINPQLSLKASYTRMSQYVHQVNESYINLPTDTWIPVSRKLKPMQSDQLAVGAYYTTGNKIYSFSIEGYYKWMKHLMDYKDNYQFLPPSTSWEDKLTQGKGRSYGVELIARKEKGKITGWAGYTLSWNDRQFTEINKGKRFPAKFDNRHKFNIIANWKIKPKLELTGSWTYATGNRLTVSFENYQAVSPQHPFPGGSLVPPYIDSGGLDYYTERNNFQLPAYHRLDLGINIYRPKKKNRMGIWNISIYNVYSYMAPVSIRKGWWYNNDCFYTLGIVPIIPSVSYTYKF